MRQQDQGDIQNRNNTRYAYTDGEIQIVNNARNKEASYQLDENNRLEKKDGSFVKDDQGRTIIEIPACDSNGGLSPIESSLSDFFTKFEEGNFKDNYPIKILFPYKLDSWHWNVGEIIISVDGKEKYDIKCCRYDSCGYISTLEQTVQDGIEKLFKQGYNVDFQPKLNVKIASVQKGIACGLYAARAMHNLKTRSLEIKSPNQNLLEESKETIWKGIFGEFGIKEDQVLRDEDSQLVMDKGNNNDRRGFCRAISEEHFVNLEQLKAYKTKLDAGQTKNLSKLKRQINSLEELCNNDISKALELLECLQREIKKYQSSEKEELEKINNLRKVLEKEDNKLLYDIVFDTKKEDKPLLLIPELMDDILQIIEEKIKTLKEDNHLKQKIGRLYSISAYKLEDGSLSVTVGDDIFNIEQNDNEISIKLGESLIEDGDQEEQYNKLLIAMQFEHLLSGNEPDIFMDDQLVEGCDRETRIKNCLANYQEMGIGIIEKEDYSSLFNFFILDKEIINALRSCEEFDDYKYFHLIISSLVLMLSGENRINFQETIEQLFNFLDDLLNKEELSLLLDFTLSNSINRIRGYIENLPDNEKQKYLSIIDGDRFKKKIEEKNIFQMVDNFEEFSRCIVERNIHIAQKDNFGNSFLHLSTDSKVINYLLSHHDVTAGIVNAQNEDGKTALDLAEDYPEKQELLLKGKILYSYCFVTVNSYGMMVKFDNQEQKITLANYEDRFDISKFSLYEVGSGYALPIDGLQNDQEKRLKLLKAIDNQNNFYDAFINYLNSSEDFDKEKFSEYIKADGFTINNYHIEDMLIKACEGQKMDAIKFLIEKGVNVNLHINVDYANCPLNLVEAYALPNRNIELIELLIDNGLKMDLDKRINGQTIEDHTKTNFFSDDIEKQKRVGELLTKSQKSKLEKSPSNIPSTPKADAVKDQPKQTCQQ